MKQNKRLLPVILLPVLLLCFSSARAQEPDAKLKVMTYNIWNGFDWGKDTIRKENWARWIRDKNPDVLGPCRNYADIPKRNYGPMRQNGDTHM